VPEVNRFNTRSLAALPLRLVGHALAAPVRLAAKRRPPAVEHPELLTPGQPPDVGGRLLVLYDGGCGICLHVRDLFELLDRADRVANDRIARNADYLLGDLDEESTFSSFHVIHPGGRRESGGAGLAALVETLPPLRLLGRAMRRFPGATDAVYDWFARNRPWISQGTGLINHPQRDPSEQPELTDTGDV
jgi:predicted DCC family thiol-disulfide oxidoreductase YuxK